MVEADGAVTLLPAVSVMEAEARGKLVPAPVSEVVLRHHEDPGTEFRPPDVRVEEGAVVARVVDEGRHDDDQVAFRHHEVVDHAQGVEGQGRCLHQHATGVDVVEQEGGFRVHRVAEGPQLAAGLDLRVGGEGQALQTLAP